MYIDIYKYILYTYTGEPRGEEETKAHEEQSERLKGKGKKKGDQFRGICWMEFVEGRKKGSEKRERRKEKRKKRGGRARSL